MKSMLHATGFCRKEICRPAEVGGPTWLHSLHGRQPGAGYAQWTTLLVSHPPDESIAIRGVTGWK